MDPPVLHITHVKAGSQWVYRVLADAFPGRVVRPMGDSVHATGYPILSGLVYPTVYLTREEVDFCHPPPGWCGVVVIRDLRDTLVSMYYSYRYSHPDIDDPALSARLQAVRESSYEEGMQFCMRTRLADVARMQVSWLDADLPLIRYEELVADEAAGFRRFLGHCGLEVTDRQLAGLLRPASFRASTGRHAGEEDPTAHNRKGVVGDWRNHLDGTLLEEFKALYDDELVATGYERDGGWGGSRVGGGRPDLPPAAPSPPRRSPGEVRARALSRERRLVAEQVRELAHLAADPLVADRLRLGPGFHAPEREDGVDFRWVGEDAAIVVEGSSGRRRGLILDVAPGPGVGRERYELELVDREGRRLAGARGPQERGQVRLRCRVPAGEKVALHLRSLPGGLIVPGPDQRVLNLRLYRIGWT